MSYRYVASGLEGFVARVVQLAGHGYYFYVFGRIPDEKSPDQVDQKLLDKYEVELTRDQRYRRKRAGAAALHYIRVGQDFVLLATCGKHQFFQDERGEIRDLRQAPLRIGGYSISVRQKQESGGKYRARVRIDKESYRLLRDTFLELSVHRKADALAGAFYSVPFEPYQPIRQQLFRILVEVNRRRKKAGFKRVPYSCIRWKHRPRRYFADHNGHSCPGDSLMMAQ